LGREHCLLYSTEGKVYWTTGHYDRGRHLYTPKCQGVLDHGAFYAPKSFAAPRSRRVLWGWIQETRAEIAAAGWAGAMSLPRVLSVDPNGRLQFEIAAEAEQLRGEGEKFTLSASAPLRRRLSTLRQEVSLSVEKASPTVRLYSAGKAVWEITLDFAGKTVHCGERSFPLPVASLPADDLRLYLDASVLEAFVAGCEALTSRVYSLKPGEVELEITLNGKGSASGTLWPLNAISQDRLSSG
jgi:beta-fructofuranosidase